MDTNENVLTKIRTDMLLQWYWQEKRNLPWREDRNPYTIWISEIMLQQTRVETVKPYYYRFIEQFPTIENLANASEQIVLKAWEGLGYYSRARNLHKAAKQIVEKHQCKMPTEYQQIKALPGIGDYTAGAIMSIAYNQPYPAVDGNVLRVFARWYNIHEVVTKMSTKKEIEQLVIDCIPDGYASDFNQSLMDLGSAICIAKYPRCENCPVTEYCKAYQKGQQQLLPIKEIKKKPIAVSVASVFIDDSNKILLEKRSSEGMLANMWQFPMEEGTSSQEALEKLQARLKVQFPKIIATNEIVCNIEHIYSHRHWFMSVYSGRNIKNADTNHGTNEQDAIEKGTTALQSLVKETDENIDVNITKKVTSDVTYYWATHEELECLPLPMIFKKAMIKVSE